MGYYPAPILYGPSSFPSGQAETAGTAEAAQVEDHDKSNEKGQSLGVQGGEEEEH
jgi:hypothetical protein